MAEKNTAISNEELVSALIASRTVKEAASKVGLQPKAVYERMGNSEFQICYTMARAEIVRTTVESLQGRITEAVETVAQIMADPKANAAVRLQAAQTILNTSVRLSESLAKVDEKVFGKAWISTPPGDEWNF